jgi:hypothetical protein
VQGVGEPGAQFGIAQGFTLVTEIGVVVPEALKASAVDVAVAVTALRLKIRENRVGSGELWTVTMI